MGKLSLSLAGRPPKDGIGRSRHRQSPPSCMAAYPLAIRHTDEGDRQPSGLCILEAVRLLQARQLRTRYIQPKLSAAQNARRGAFCTPNADAKSSRRALQGRISR